MLPGVANGVKHSTFLVSLTPLKKPMFRYYFPYPHFRDGQTLSIGVVMALGQGSVLTQSFLVSESLLVAAFNLQATLLVQH